MKYLMILSIATLFSGLAVAEEDAVQLCVTMLQKKQQQAEVANKISNTQAKSYCQCIIPKIEQLKTQQTFSQQELNQSFTSCMTQAGIKQPIK